MMRIKRSLYLRLYYMKNSRTMTPWRWRISKRIWILNTTVAVNSISACNHRMTSTKIWATVHASNQQRWLCQPSSHQSSPPPSSKWIMTNSERTCTRIRWALLKSTHAASPSSAYANSLVAKVRWSLTQDSTISTSTCTRCIREMTEAQKWRRLSHAKRLANCSLREKKSIGTTTRTKRSWISLRSVWCSQLEWTSSKGATSTYTLMGISQLSGWHTRRQLTRPETTQVNVFRRWKWSNLITGILGNCLTIRLNKI